MKLQARSRGGPGCCPGPKGGCLLAQRDCFRRAWQEAGQASYDKPRSLTLADSLQPGRGFFRGRSTCIAPSSWSISTIPATPE